MRYLVGREPHFPAEGIASKQNDEAMEEGLFPAWPCPCSIIAGT